MRKNLNGSGGLESVVTPANSPTVPVPGSQAAVGQQLQPNASPHSDSAVTLVNSPTLPAVVSREVQEQMLREFPGALFSLDRTWDEIAFSTSSGMLLLLLRTEFQPLAQKYSHKQKALYRSFLALHSDHLKRDSNYQYHFQWFTFLSKKLAAGLEATMESKRAGTFLSGNILLRRRQLQAASELFQLFLSTLSGDPLAKQMAELNPKKLAENFSTLTADPPGAKRKPWRQRAAELFLSGKNIRTICRTINPKYAEKTETEKKRYHRSVKAALDREISSKKVTK
jgi:hypothetical protein